MSASLIRTAHGKGAPVLLRVETPPLDEIDPPNAEQTRQGIEVATRRGRPFERGNKAASGRKPSLCLLGLPIETADPRYRRALRKARSYMQRRASELAILHGGYLGTGPASNLANAALALAASRVLYELASVTLDPALFAQAAKLADSARQQELTAVALAEREGDARAKAGPVHTDPVLAAAHARLMASIPKAR